jgi:3-oxoacyl-(acyl-carrier-protein) synthase
MSKKVAITGMGLLCHQAETPEALWHQVLKGKQVISHVHCLDGSNPVVPVLRISSEIGQELADLRIRRMKSADDLLRFAAFAAARAWRNAGMKLPSSARSVGNKLNAAVIVGTSRGPMDKISSLFTGLPENPKPRIPSDSAYASLHGTLASALDAHGPAFTISTACASGAHAVALAADQIRCGRVPVALAGAADAPLHFLLVRAMSATGILDFGGLQPVCRPFSQDRTGTILGEGAAFVVLEDADHARQRGAQIHGYLSGSGMAADGRVSSPEGAGAIALECAVARAMEDAGIGAADLGYINCHGTGTLINDSLECEWLTKFDRSRSAPIPYSSTKSITGHCLGATPVLELIICLMAMKHGVLPPSVNCTRPMSGAPPGLVLDPATKWNTRYAMSNAIGFWGGAVSLILAKDID